MMHSVVSYCWAASEQVDCMAFMFTAAVITVTNLVYLILKKKKNNLAKYWRWSEDFISSQILTNFG